MRAKYIEEKHGIYNDGMGTLYIGRYSTEGEAQIDVSKLSEEDLKKLLERYHDLLEEYIDICLDYAKKHPKNFTKHYYK